jgi:hypothetical protein
LSSRIAVVALFLFEALGCGAGNDPLGFESENVVLADGGVKGDAGTRRDGGPAPDGGTPDAGWCCKTSSGSSKFSCLHELWNRESAWCYDRE